MMIWGVGQAVAVFYGVQFSDGSRGKLFLRKRDDYRVTSFRVRLALRRQRDLKVSSK